VARAIVTGDVTLEMPSRQLAILNERGRI